MFKQPFFGYLTLKNSYVGLLIWNCPNMICKYDYVIYLQVLTMEKTKH